MRLDTMSTKLFGQRLRAFVVASPGVKLAEYEIKQHVKGNLASCEVPRDVVFSSELPRTATGKVSKRELTAR